MPEFHFHHVYSRHEAHFRPLIEAAVANHDGRSLKALKFQVEYEETRENELLANYRELYAKNAPKLLWWRVRRLFIHPKKPRNKS